MPASSSLRRIRIGLPGAARGFYPVWVGSGLLATLGRRLGGAGGVLRASRVFVVTDSRVAPLYGAPLLASLARAGIPARLLAVPAGERSKTRAAKARLEDRMLAGGAGRDAAVVALGGGMISDLAGFTAATLNRGVPYVTVPTTLLAMVDAAVGGKTAVNHPRGKNLIGAFHSPRAVFADVATLATLPERQFRSGLAEVVKTAALGDAGLFRRMERSPAAVLMRHPGALTDMVEACCRVKGKVVEADERESNLRAVLNFGHTLGHALELLSSYRLAHGEAVAVGLALESRAAASAGILKGEDAERVIRLLRALGLPTRPPRGLSPSRILAAARSDKKARRGELRYALPRRIGTMARRRGSFALSLPDSLVLDILRRA